MAKNKVTKDCKHDWRYKESDFRKEQKGYNNIYSKVDIYECHSCHEKKEKISRTEENHNDPMWWR